MAYKISFNNRHSGELDSKTVETEVEIANAIIDLATENMGAIEPGDFISVEFAK